MRYFYIGLGVLILLLLLLFLIFCLRRKWAEKKVCRMSTEEKSGSFVKPFPCLDFAITAATIGKLQDVLLAEQMGYCRFFDEAAPSMNMVFECEPVYFSYNKKRYLIDSGKDSMAVPQAQKLAFMSIEAIRPFPRKSFFMNVPAMKSGCLCGLCCIGTGKLF